MKTVSDGLLSGVHMPEQGVSELEDITLETSETEKLENKDWIKERINYPMSVGQPRKV